MRGIQAFLLYLLNDDVLSLQVMFDEPFFSNKWGSTNLMNSFGTVLGERMVDCSKVSGSVIFLNSRTSKKPVLS